MSEVLGEQLFPGIPNEINGEKVSPKLPWKVLRTLSSVNRSWREAITTRQFYQTRVSANSAEASVVHTHWRANTEVIALYSTSDDRCYELPGIPQLGNRIPLSCQCVSLDVKIYVIGSNMCRPLIKGEQPPLDHVSAEACAEVYVLDVAWQGEWEQCTAMQEPRYKFGCGVLEEKIYVLGGYGLGYGKSPVSESEVYDPKIDAWSPVMPILSLRTGYQIETVDGDIFAYGGFFSNPNSPQVYAGWYLEVYHPTTNEWRLVKPFGRLGSQLLLVARGKLHSLQKGCIDVYDMD